MDDRPSDLRVAPTRPGQYEPATPPRRSWLRRALWLIVILLIAAALGWVIFHRQNQAPPPSRFGLNGQPMPVVAATVTQGAMPVTLAALGTVTPLATVTVTTQINGQLMSVGFTEGQHVKKGDFLAQIDPRPYQAALDQLQGQLLKDQALLKGAQVDLARYQKLAAQNSIARQQADDQLYLVHQYQGTVTADEAQVENAKLNLSYCHIVSPVTGRIGLRLVDPGNYVQTSSATGIAVVTQEKPMSVVFTLPEDNVTQVLKRLHSGAKLEVIAYDRSGTTKLATGTLATIDNQIDPTTGTFKLRALFANDDEILFPNQFVNTQLIVDTLQNATLIPVAAVQRGAPGTFVYLIKPDDTVTVQKVTLGPGNSTMVAVSAGLSPGERVVVEGADKLREGAKVTIPGQNASAQKGPTQNGQPAAAPQKSGEASGRPSRSSP